MRQQGRARERVGGWRQWSRTQPGGGGSTATGLRKQKSVSGRQRDLASVMGPTVKRVPGLWDKFGAGRLDPEIEARCEERLSPGGSGLSQGNKRRVRVGSFCFCYRLTAAAPVKGGLRAVRNDRQSDPGGITADHKGRVGGRELEGAWGR